MNNQEDLYTYQEGTTSVWNLQENINPILIDNLELSENLFGENN